MHTASTHTCGDEGHVTQKKAKHTDILCYVSGRKLLVAGQVRRCFVSGSPHSSCFRHRYAISGQADTAVHRVAWCVLGPSVKRHQAGTHEASTTKKARSACCRSVPTSYVLGPRVHQDTPPGKDTRMRLFFTHTNTRTTCAIDLRSSRLMSFLD